VATPAIASASKARTTREHARIVTAPADGRAPSGVPVDPSHKDKEALIGALDGPQRAGGTVLPQIAVRVQKDLPCRRRAKPDWQALSRQ
jgi:hypothetical protein